MNNLISNFDNYMQIQKEGNHIVEKMNLITIFVNYHIHCSSQTLDFCYVWQIINHYTFYA